MSVVLRAAGLPRRSLRLRDSDDALREAAMAIPCPVVSPDHVDRLIAEVLALRELYQRVRSVTHDRGLPSGLIA